jgi:predicted porin
MKASLTAALLIAAYAGSAAAQSSVTVFGIMDLSANDIKNGTARGKYLMSNMLTADRLGFRGIEDLGGGLRTSFWLELATSPDDGTAGGSNGLGTAFFNRRSTVSLSSDSWGELRLGRDFTPTWWNIVWGDTYGANGLGVGFNLLSTLGSGAITQVRDNNSIGYFLPGNLAGVYGQAMVAASEGVSGQKYSGGRIGYSVGALDVAAAYGATKITNQGEFKEANIGGSYDFKVIKLFGYYNKNYWRDLSQVVYEVSFSVPVGLSEIKSSYGKADASGRTAGGADTSANDANLVSAQYLYNLSKRTALYTGVARIQNKGASGFSIAPGTLATGLAGHNSTGYNVGIRHFF